MNQKLCPILKSLQSNCTYQSLVTSFQRPGSSYSTSCFSDFFLSLCLRCSRNYIEINRITRMLTRAARQIASGAPPTFYRRFPNFRWDARNFWRRGRRESGEQSFRHVESSPHSLFGVATRLTWRLQRVFRRVLRFRLASSFFQTRWRRRGLARTRSRQRRSCFA